MKTNFACGNSLCRYGHPQRVDAGLVEHRAGAEAGIEVGERALAVLGGGMFRARRFRCPAVVQWPVEPVPELRAANLKRQEVSRRGERFEGDGGAQRESSRSRRPGRG